MPKTLTSLSLATCTELDERCLERLVAVAPNLARLSLAHLPQLQDAWLRPLHELRSLAWLDLSSSKGLTAAAVAELTPTTLAELCVRDCPWFGAESLRRLMKIPGLRRIGTGAELHVVEAVDSGRVWRTR